MFFFFLKQHIHKMCGLFFTAEDVDKTMLSKTIYEFPFYRFHNSTQLTFGLSQTDWIYTQWKTELNNNLTNRSINSNGHSDDRIFLFYWFWNVYIRLVGSEKRISFKLNSRQMSMYILDVHIIPFAFTTYCERGFFHLISVFKFTKK